MSAMGNLQSRKRELKCIGLALFVETGAAYRCPQPGHSEILLNSFDAAARQAAYEAATECTSEWEQGLMQQAMLETHKRISDRCWLCNREHHIH
jgi:hypothetical protein